FFQAEDGIRDRNVTGVQTCALPIITKHGATLLADDAYQAFLDELVPLATIITPNFFEAQKLTGLELKNEDEIKQGARKLQKMGVKNFLIKGSHHYNNIIVINDIIWYIEEM